MSASCWPRSRCSSTTRPTPSASRRCRTWNRATRPTRPSGRGAADLQRVVGCLGLGRVQPFTQLLQGFAAHGLADLREPLLFLLFNVVADVLDEHGDLRVEAL